jgi:hypothetical protein
VYVSVKSGLCARTLNFGIFGISFFKWYLSIHFVSLDREVATIVTQSPSMYQHTSNSSSSNNNHHTNNLNNSSNSGGIYRMTSGTTSNINQRSTNLPSPYSSMNQQRPHSSHIGQHHMHQSHQARQSFRPSPFYKDVQSLTQPRMCHGM